MPGGHSAGRPARVRGGLRVGNSSSSHSHPDQRNQCRRRYRGSRRNWPRPARLRPASWTPSPRGLNARGDKPVRRTYAVSRCIHRSSSPDPSTPWCSVLSAFLLRGGSFTTIAAGAPFSTAVQAQASNSQTGDRGYHAERILRQQRPWPIRQPCASRADHITPLGPTTATASFAGRNEKGRLSRKRKAGLDSIELPAGGGAADGPNV